MVRKVGIKNRKNAKLVALDVIRKSFSLKNINIENIIFFGSRARGDNKRDSDWDFLVVVDKELNFREKSRIIIEIKRSLARLGIPNDLLVQSRDKFNFMKSQPGNISYAANIEGISL